MYVPNMGIAHQVELGVAFGLHKYVFLVMGDGNIFVYVVHNVCEPTNGH